MRRRGASRSGSSVVRARLPEAGRATRAAMPIQVGQRVPDGTLSEFIEQETPGCVLGPNNFEVSKLVAGKRIVLFGLPGAFTPTCSAAWAR